MSSAAPIIHKNIIQGSSQWLNLRSGIPTSSEFDKIVTPGGKPSKSAEGYMYKLLAERIMGHPCQEFMSHWMDRGSALESEALAFYCFTREVKTYKIGFITNAEGTIGCSPDCGVIDREREGLLEIKVPNEQTHMSYLLGSGSAYDAYKVQMSGQLWVSQKSFNDSLSFHPELPPALIRVERDEKFIAIMAELVTTFSLELERMFRAPQAFLNGQSCADIAADRKQLSAGIAEESSWSRPSPLPPLSELTASEAMKKALLDLQGRNAK